MQSQNKIKSSNILKKHEREKKRDYNERVMNIEQGTVPIDIYHLRGHTGSDYTAFHKSLVV